MDDSLEKHQTQDKCQTIRKAFQKISLNQTSQYNQFTNPQNLQSKIKTKNIKIFSQAYPSFKGANFLDETTNQCNSNDNSVGQKKVILQPEVKSQIHQKLLQINFTPESHHNPILIRQFQLSDLAQLKKLQDQWFPIRYTDEFYKKIIRKQCYCLVAETLIKSPSKHNQNEQKSPTEVQQKIMVGAAVFELTDSSGYAYKSWSDTFYDWFRISSDSIYIMTLGVIDEFRKKGVGKLLIASIIEVANQWKSVKLVYLHVISYNNAAINFYKKNGFTMLENLQNFYHVGGSQFGGQVYGIFVNGGRHNSKLSQWLRKLLT